MSKLSGRNGIAVGLIVGLGLTVLLVLFLGAIGASKENIASSAEQCENSAEECAQEQGGFQDTGAGARRLVAAEDTLAQWLMAAFGVAATLISYKAVLLLQDTLEATRLTIVEAEKGTAAAQAAVVVTEDIGKKQLRAYLGSVGVRIQPEGDPNQPNVRVGFHFTFFFRNVGVTPAGKVVVTGDHQFVMRGAPIRHLEASDHPPEEDLGGYDGSHLGPGQDIGGARTYFKIGNLLALRGSQEMLVITGRVDYVDIFGARHFVRISNSVHVLTDENGLQNMERPFETMFGFMLYGNGNQGD